MSKPVRSRMSASARREQIIDSTRKVAVEEGFHAVTIERISKECGVTRTLVYQQFGTLSALLKAMVDREFQVAARGLLRAMQQSPSDKRDQFMFTLEGILNAVDEAPETWKMFLLPSEGGPPELYESLSDAVDFTYKFLGSSLQAVSGEISHLADADPELTVRLMHVIGDELVKLHLKDPDNYPAERVLKQADWVTKALFHI